MNLFLCRNSASLNKKLALITPKTELQKAQDFLNHIQVFSKNNRGEFDVIELT